MATKLKYSGFFLFLIGASLLLSSCSKVTKRTVSKSLEEGDWIISYYSTEGMNQTTTYYGYTFKFSSDGIVTGTRAGTIVSGSWDVVKDKNNDESSSDRDFPLSFPVVDDLNDLNVNWELVRFNDNTLVLQDFSSGTETDFLTFTKF